MYSVVMNELVSDPSRIVRKYESHTECILCMHGYVCVSVCVGMLKSMFMCVWSIECVSSIKTMYVCVPDVCVFL